MAQKMLMLIPWFVMAAIVGLPALCVVLYRRRRLGGCLLCSHLWCMIAFCLLGMFLLHTVQRQQQRADNADKANKLLQMCRTLRAGKVEESQMLLDDHLAGALYRTAYDVPDAKMGELDTDVLWVWQQAKEYYDTYDVNEPYVQAVPRALVGNATGHQEVWADISKWRAGTGAAHQYEILDRAALTRRVTAGQGCSVGLLEHALRSLRQGASQVAGDSRGVQRPGIGCDCLCRRRRKGNEAIHGEARLHLCSRHGLASDGHGLCGQSQSDVFPDRSPGLPGVGARASSANRE